jgi:hypothetical protein
MPDPVPPPAADSRHVPAADVQPQPDRELVYGLMEARDCSKPAAERYLDEHGADHCERLLRARWLG